ncbi:MAG: response regulator [Deltaproteobacteria bacterium HGW-Deltaproteobacteria-14]|jgi:two-component system chemotaxis response regulator CheY|nr:MAG: response regulator [Deltaproteobacteria bacterium HGW-Deltaproteobacteria-14]
MLKKIMIVDDSKIMRLVIRRTLRQAGFDDFEMVEADDGREAIDVYERERPDLVLADWDMPVMGGLELLRHLRAFDPQVRLGFVTSEQSPESRTTARQAGARFLITKPFTPNDFKLTLDLMMRVG